jgi:hypothetical protein
MSEDMIKSVQHLINLGKGDPDRLAEILNTLKQKSPLYFSDYKYLEDLLSQKEETRSKTDVKNEVKQVKQVKNPKQKDSSKNSTNDAFSILRARLAAGEITFDEFQAIKKILKEN